MAAARQMREGGDGPDLLSRMAGDSRIGLDRQALTTLFGDEARFIGAALEQADAFVAEVEGLLEQIPEAAAYSPGEIL